MFHYRVLFLILLLCPLGIAQVPAQNEGKEAVASLELLEITPTSHGSGWNVLLHNRSDSAITAFAVEIHTYFDDNTDVRAVQTIDFILAEEHLQPGATREKSLQSVEKENANITEVAINPLMILFADLSYEGDTTYAEQILLSREAAQLPRVHWLRSLRQLAARPLDEEQLAEELRQTIHRLENHTDRLSNRRVSTNHHSARLKESILADSLKKILESPSNPGLGLRERLQLVLRSLEDELIHFSERVTHDLEAKPLRKTRRR